MFLLLAYAVNWGSEDISGKRKTLRRLARHVQLKQFFPFHRLVFEVQGIQKITNH